jgi:hypothetical protein
MKSDRNGRLFHGNFTPASSIGRRVSRTVGQERMPTLDAEVTMLVRVSCNRCCLSSLWTDDPRWFLESVCNGGERCEATLVVEQFAGVVISRIADALDPLGLDRARRKEDTELPASK